MSKLVNGCVKEETLKLYNKFSNNPHVGTMMMVRKDCGCETVYVGFSHYSEEYTVEFDVDTQEGIVGYELMENGKFLNEKEYYGEITVKSLENLLNSLPHINSFIK